MNACILRSFYYPVFGTLLALLLLVAACEKDNDDDTQTASCDNSVRPIVMMHGLLASGDTYANQFMRFSSNNYCESRLYAFDWNTLSQNTDHVALLDAFIDDVLAETGATQVDLAGHSAGGGLGYNYLSDATRAAKVAHYAHIGSSPQPAAAGPNADVPTINIWSQADSITAGADIPGATNVMQASADHYEVATNAETFEAMYSFFNGGTSPATTSIIAQSSIEVAGKAVRLAENYPLSNTTVEIYEVNSATGERLTASPTFTSPTDDEGVWGPVSIKANTTYEFVVDGNQAQDRPIHYYREGFTRSNPLVYLRSIPPPGSLAGTLLSSLPKDDGQAVLVVFTANGAVISGRDQLTIDTLELSTPELTSADQNTIAIFMYDDGDDQSSGDKYGFFGSIPFINGIDLFFPTTQPTYVPITFNGETLYVRNWKSDTEGVSIAVFD